MTFLELVKRLSREAGMGQGPTTTVGQAGDYLQAVEWIQAAYEDVQATHPNWNFLQKAISYNTDVGVVATDVGSWKPDSFRCYLAATGVADEQFLGYVPYDTFRDSYLFGASRSQTGRPTIITIEPDDDLLLWPTADAVYTVVGEYYMKPEAFTTDTSVPLFDSYHLVIVWRALQYYGAYASEPDKDAAGQREYRRLMRKLEMTELPTILYGPSWV